MKDLQIINNNNMIEALEMIMFGVAVKVVIAYFTAIQDKGMAGLLALLGCETFPMVEEFYKAKEEDKKANENKEIELDMIEETKKDIAILENKSDIYTTSRDLKELKELKAYLKELEA